MNFLSWERFLNDPVVFVWVMVIVGALLFSPLIWEGLKMLYDEINNYFFAPRKYPWIRGWGAKEWEEGK